MGKPIRRIQSVGSGIRDLGKMGWSGSDVVCAVCFAALPSEEKVSMRGA